MLWLLPPPPPTHKKQQPLSRIPILFVTNTGRFACFGNEIGIGYDTHVIICIHELTGIVGCGICLINLFET